jgi:hypothetical protein
MSQERIAPVSRMRQTGNCGNCGALERSGAEMNRGIPRTSYFRESNGWKFWPRGAGFTPPAMAFDEAS